MNPPPPGTEDLDQRLSRLMGTLDAGPGFGERLAERLAREQALLDPAPRERQRARIELERVAAEAALRRRLRVNMLWVASAAVTAIAPALFSGRLLAHALSAPGGGIVIALASGAACIAWLASVAARAARGEAPAALLA